MQPWIGLFIFAVTAFASSSNALASRSSATAIPSNTITYLAPLNEGCSVGDPNCGKIEGKYLVSLREGYTPSSHLAYISQNLDVDPVKEWSLRWSGDEYYSVSNVSAKSLDILRQDPGVEEVEESYWFQMVEVDPCRNPKYSEEQRKTCYEEEDIPPCDRPSLSKDQRRSCYDMTLLDPCENPMLEEDEKRSCQETSSLDPCKKSELSEDQKWSCRLNKLADPCNNPPLSEREERMCAGIPRTEDSEVLSRAEL
jgi:hypothetical protein